MGLSVGTIWESRPGSGASTGGGGFVACNYAVSATVANGGTGGAYLVGDILTVNSGTNLGVAATFRVDSVSGSQVATVSVRETGAYTTNPNAATATTTNSATGVGCTLAVTLAAATDYTLQANAQASWLSAAGTYTNDLVITNVTNSVVTSAAGGAAFVGAVGGNIFNATAGTNITAGRYQIVSANATAGSITLDRDAATGAGITGSGYLGGSVSGIIDINAILVAGNTVYEKYNASADAPGAFTLTAGTVGAYISWIGYNTTRGDLTVDSSGGTWSTTHTAPGFLDVAGSKPYPTVAMSTNTCTLGGFNYIAGLNFTCSKSGNCFTSATSPCAFFRVKAVNSSTNAASVAFALSVAFHTLIDCDIACAGTSASFAITMASTNVPLEVIGCRLTSTSGGGVNASNSGHYKFVDSLFYAMSGRVAIQIAGTASSTLIKNCTFDTIGTCFTSPNSAVTINTLSVINNLITNCTTGFSNLRTATTRLLITGGHNRFGTVTTPYLGWANVTDTTGYLAGDVSTSFTNGTEYVAQGSNDFRLLYASGAKGAGLINGEDIGCWQRVENLPAVGNVKLAVKYGQDAAVLGTPDELTGTQANISSGGGGLKTGGRL